MSSGHTPVVVNAKSKHTATVIFLHGLGDTGNGWSNTISSLLPPHVKCICPTAGALPVTLNGGFVMPSWFDLMTLDPAGPEDAAGIAKAAEVVKAIMQEEETAHGIPSKRILIGGFSQGGGLAVHVGLRYPRPIAGILALSAWLPLHKEYPAAMTPGQAAVPLLQCHGDMDQIVPFQWGALTAEALKRLMSDYHFKTYKGLSHSSCPEELNDAKAFIIRCLPAV